MQELTQKIGQELSSWSTFLKTISRNLKGEKFESEVFVLQRFLSPGAVCLDIGAAYGRYAFQMSQLVGPGGHVYCYEPGDYSYNVIKKVIRFHRLNNVTLIKKALSNRTGVASLTIPIKGGHKLGPSLAHLSTDQAENGLTQTSVTTTTVDQFCEEQKISQLKFIKCDVEGAELLVFEGAEKTLERFRPAVLSEVETEHLKKFNTSPTDVFNFFFKIGYRAYLLCDGDFKYITHPEGDRNYFFLHPLQKKIL